MALIDAIIKTMDDELLRTGKEYLDFLQASQLLCDARLIDDPSELDELLESGQMLHARPVVEEGIVTWEIPLSADGEKKREKIGMKQNIYTGKVLDLKSDIPIDVRVSEKCPGCGWDLVIPDSCRNEKYLRCLNCGKTFLNPLLQTVSQEVTEKGLEKSRKGWWVAAGIILCLWIAGSLSDDSDRSSEKVRNSELDASVHQVKRYLKREYLADPDSYKGISWSKVTKTLPGENGTYCVRHQYRAKNSLGGYVVKNQLFYLDEDGDVVAVRDL